jgi:GNAT superfamily N-acetyltransferase
MEWAEAGGYVVSDDPERLDLDRVWRWLADESYWAAGRPKELVERSIAGSVNLGAYLDDDQVGFCRWVTDGATFAWLCDVFVDQAHRGKGVGTALVGRAVDHPAVRDVRRQLLATQDAHDVYRRFGFVSLAAPERWMERTRS